MTPRGDMFDKKELRRFQVQRTLFAARRERFCPKRTLARRDMPEPNELPVVPRAGLLWTFDYRQFGLGIDIPSCLLEQPRGV